MSGRSVYLDTSALVKRYVIEPGTDVVDSLYEEAHKGYATIGFSIWNIGEASVVFDKYARRGLLEDGRKPLERLLGESRLLLSLESLKLIDITQDLLMESIKLVFKHHIYIADSLQIASARKGFNHFMTADKKLAEKAEDEGMTVILID